MRYEGIDGILYNNSFKMLEQREIKRYLFIWKKDITIRIISMIPVTCLAIFFIYIFIDSYCYADMVDKSVTIGIIIFLWGIIGYGFFDIGKEITKYYVAKTGTWMRSIAYIMKNERGKLQIKYVKEGSVCVRDIDKSFGVDKRRLEENIYITFIIILATEIVIILKDTGWAVFSK